MLHQILVNLSLIRKIPRKKVRRVPAGRGTKFDVAQELADIDIASHIPDHPVAGNYPKASAILPRLLVPRHPVRIKMPESEVKLAVGNRIRPLLRG